MKKQTTTAGGALILQPMRNLRRVELEAPTRLTNATSAKRLHLTSLLWASALRPGSQDFLKCKSRGQAC